MNTSTVNRRQSLFDLFVKYNEMLFLQGISLEDRKRINNRRLYILRLIEKDTLECFSQRTKAPVASSNFAERARNKGIILNTR